MVDDQTPVAKPAQDTTQPGFDETRADTAANAPTLVPAGAAAAAMFSLPPPGYELGVAIGRGGMGEVVAATDLRIGRDVAVKRMTAPKPTGEQTVRFLREARIQARLEHPAIVPVHELGIDDKGRLFFTMKRLAGKTFGHRLVDGMAQNPALRAIVDVTNAIEFSHRRGVVHRDLKPSNIMLGEYGEVYVIDWGIARVLSEDSEEDPKISASDISTLDDDSTKSGALLGTPGYMSPEQLRGQRATTAADIYALGAILFEVLAGETLHKRGEAGIATTLSDPQESPAKRKPDRNIAPELDELCWRMLAELPEERPTARQVADAIQAYLDGDRDLARRRELASEQLAAAKVALESSDSDGRARAMRHAGYAFSLDPTSEEAGTMVSALLLEPPPTLPPDLAKSLADYEAKQSADRSRQAAWTYSALFLLLPAAFFVHIKAWGLLFGFYGVVLLALLSAVYSARARRPPVAVVLVVNLALIALFSRIASPLILTPLLVAAGLVAFTSIRWINDRMWAVVGWTMAAVLIPFALEMSGLLPWTWQTHDGFTVIRSNLITSTGPVIQAVVIVGSLIMHLALALWLLFITRRRRQAQNQLFIQAWHLRQLLPSTQRR